MLTYETFIAEYPEFKTASAAFVNRKLTQAALRIDPNVWGVKQDMGHGLITAVMLCRSPSGKTAQMVPEAAVSYERELRALLKEVTGKARPIL